MEITIDTPKLPDLPPLPAGIEIPDTAEELFRESVVIVLYGKPKKSLWGTPREEVVARQEIFMSVPGRGVCEFHGPLAPVHAVTAQFRGKECNMVCNHPLPLGSLRACDKWTFDVTLHG